MDRGGCCCLAPAIPVGDRRVTLLMAVCPFTVPAGALLHIPAAAVLLQQHVYTLMLFTRGPPNEAAPHAS